MFKILLNKRAHTITELFVASVVIIFLFTATFGAFVFTKNSYSNHISRYDLQRNVNIVMNRMIRGTKQSNGTFGLRSAVSFTLPVAIPALSKIDFVDSDGTHRMYYLNNNTIVYYDPTQVPSQKVVYTAPANSTITLRFSPVHVDMEVVRVYLSVSKVVNNKTIAGSITTDVTLRNAPK